MDQFTEPDTFVYQGRVLEIDDRGLLGIASAICALVASSLLLVWLLLPRPVVAVRPVVLPSVDISRVGELLDLHGAEMMMKDPFCDSLMFLDGHGEVVGEMALVGGDHVVR